MKQTSHTLRRILRSGLLALAYSTLAAEEKELAALQADAQKSFKQHVAPFVKEYCLECHGNRRSKAGLNFEIAVKKPGDASFGEKWRQAIANVSAHDMPPEDSDQPPEAQRQLFLQSLAKVKYLSSQDPGAFVIRRLTKEEYGNTLQDLFSVEASIAEDLPAEVAGEGYLNSLSPLQTEQYLSIANEVLARMPAKVQQQWLGRPSAASEDARSTARKRIQTLARSAYRRPPTEAEVAVLLAVYDLGRSSDLSHMDAMRLTLKAVLVSPQFLYITPAQAEATGQKIVALDDYQLASRLSYLLWASTPDAELSQLADKGLLHEPQVLRAQALRLLTHARARALFDGFGAQWLGLSQLSTKPFDPEKFPEMTAELRAAMYDEARLFFNSILQENQSLIQFVQSDYTYLNSTLAKIYGMESSVTGAQMRRVKLPHARRGGILGMPGILATTSFPSRTSPVNRGVWVLEQVLGQHVPPAPPNVPALEKQNQKKVAHLTLRQRTELHRTNAVCANCHKILDPIGFGLENFDAIGRWREQDDTGGRVDAAGVLPSGESFSSPEELKAILAARKPELARNLIEKLMAYALCRKLEGYDHIVVDKILKTLTQDGYRSQTLILEVVTSYPFMNRRVEQ